MEFTHAQVAPVIRESGGRSRRGLIVAAVVAAAVTVIGGAAAAAGTLTCSATAAAPTGNPTAARSAPAISPASPASPASTGGQLLISPYADFARAQAGDAYMSALCDPRAGLRPVDGLRQFGCRQGEQLLVAGPACGQGIVEGAVAPGSRMVCSRPPDRDRVSSTAVSFLAADVSQHPA